MSEKDPKSSDEKKLSEARSNPRSSKSDDWVNAWESLNPDLRQEKSALDELELVEAQKISPLNMSSGSKVKTFK